MNVYKKSYILIATLLLFVGVACDRNEEPRLSFAHPTPTLSPGDTVLSLGIESNTYWTLTSDAPWCSPSLTSGYECMEVQVAVTANDEQEQRIATLTLSSTDGPMVQTMQITQQRLTPDSTTHYRLPVVFHVLYNKEGNKKQNVIEGHLAELIGEVNKLYAQCGVDLRLEFVMATHDP